MPQSQGTVLSGQSLQQRVTTGTPGIRQGGYTEQIVTELMPQYFEACLSKALFSAQSRARATSLVGVAMVGLQVWNSSSDRNLILTRVGGTIVAASASQTGVVLATGRGQIVAPTSVTAADNAQGNFIGLAAGAGLGYAAATFANAPTICRDLVHNTAGLATTGVDPGYDVEIKGAIIIPPQCWFALASLGAAGAAASNNHWAEWIEAGV